jgi:hypothetical protein
MHEPFGLIRLRACPARDPWHARTALTLYAVGPLSTATVRLNPAALKTGDVAGLLLAGRPCAWLGVERGRAGFTLVQCDEWTGRTRRVPLEGTAVWLRAECDFGAGEARFLFSLDGAVYTGLGDQPFACELSADAAGIGCTLFCLAPESGSGGGAADFDSFVLETERMREEGGPARVAGRRQAAAGPVDSRRTSSGSMTNSCSSRAVSRFMRQSQMVRPI